MRPTIRRRRLGRDGSSSGEPTSEATLTLLRGRMRGWRASLRHEDRARRRWSGGLGWRRSPRMGWRRVRFTSAGSRPWPPTERPPVGVPGQGPAHQPVDREHQDDARHRDHDDEGERSRSGPSAACPRSRRARRTACPLRRSPRPRPPASARPPGGPPPPSASPTAKPSRHPTRADRPNGVGSTRSKASPDQNPTIAPVSGPSSRAGRDRQQPAARSGWAPPMRMRAPSGPDWTIRTTKITKATRSMAAAAHGGGSHCTTST